jgi:hypothetical protein
VPLNRDALRARAGLVLVLGLCVLAALWVHGRSLVSFFTSPDDLVYLEQASGLVPTPHKLFRYLSEVLYFRIMFRIAGLEPGPYHVITLVLHMTNVILVFAFARTRGIARRTAAIGATLFGVFPLFSSVISSAVGINDELALALALGALLASVLEGIAGTVATAGLFALAMLAKESVIFLPLLAPLFAGRPRGAWVTVSVRVLLAISAVSLVLVAALRPIGFVSDPAVYSVALGPNVFHNLMTYASWAVNVAKPEPDLVGSYDPQAWRVGLWVVAGALVALRAFGAREPAIAIGLAWFVLGVLPVLPLEHLTYRHYLYPAIPGMALAAAGTALQGSEWLARFMRRTRGAPGDALAVRIASGIAVAATLAYAANAHRIVLERFSARVPGTHLALDPIHRRRELAEQALASLGQDLAPDQKRIAILLPAGTERVFGARSGHEYRQLPSGARPYDLLEESLDHGRAIQLYYPWVDTVAFLAQWSPADSGLDLFLTSQGGALEGVGKGPVAHGAVARWMMENGWYPQARDHLKRVLDVYPSDPSLRLGYSAALFRSGDRAGAIAELQEIVRTAPGDSNAIIAAHLLARFDSTAKQR